MHFDTLRIVGFALLMGCGGATPSGGSTPSGGGFNRPEKAESQEFQTQKSSTAGEAHGASASKIKSTSSQAAMKFFVVDKRKDEPMPGIVVSLQAPDGKKYYTAETDEMGYGEVLVPVGQRYEIVYLSLGQAKIAASVTVSKEPMQNIKLTLRYKRWVDKRVAVIRVPQKGQEAAEAVVEPRQAFRLDGVTFESGSAKIQAESFARLDSVVEFMIHKMSVRVEISGHTDNVGVAHKNKALSESRANACRDYIVSQGVDASRIEAVGHGDERPVAKNDSEKGRLKNRRIEVLEL